MENLFLFVLSANFIVFYVFHYTVESHIKAMGSQLLFRC